MREKNSLNFLKICIDSWAHRTTFNPYDNLIKTDIPLFPTAEIVQKIYRSRQERAFQEEDKSSFSYYSDLQSINSEDAITWSFFGPLIYSEFAKKKEFTIELFSLLEIDMDIEFSNYWLWRRIPHPDTLVSGGPEIDFAIQTQNTIVFGESKWNSGVSTKQGKLGDKDQIDLRIDFFEKYGKVIWPDIKQFVILGISNDKDITSGKISNNITLIDMTWDDLSKIKNHPCSNEYSNYLKWKKEWSTIKNDI
jgi:hypothetical protein